MRSGLGLPLLLQLAGVAVVIAEIIIPSGGLISLVALGIFAYSLYLVFANVSTAAGMAFLAADIVLVPLLVLAGVKLMARSPVTLRRKLSREEGVQSQDPGLAAWLGREGSAATDLRPAGIALIDGRRVDVLTRGDYIEEGTPVVVTAVTGNQVVVRKREPSREG